MIAIQSRIASFMKAQPVLPVRVRMRLFRQSRIISCGITLAFFPLLATVSLEPAGLIGALLLFGILPAVMALDTRRPAYLDRSITLAVLAASVVLLAGTMRGLHGISALSLLCVLCLEGFVLASRKARLPVLTTGATGIAAIALSSAFSEPFFGAGPWSLAAVAAVIIANTAVIVLGMAKAFKSSSHSSSHYIRPSELEAVLAEAVLTLDATGNVHGISANTNRLLNLPASALAGRGLVNLVLVSERPALLTLLSQAANRQSPSALRLRMRSSSDENAPQYRWVEIKVSANEESAGGLVARLRDVEDDIRNEKRIRQIEGEVEKARAAGAAFLSTINHELRTPLNAIIGFSDVLANPDSIPHSPAKAQEYAALINGAGRDLHRIIAAMVDVTRLESGMYEIEKEPSDIKAMLKQTIHAFQQDKELDETTITLLTTGTREEAVVDARAIRSALNQLLSNAIKFGGPNPSVVVSVQTSKHDLRIAVADRGAGIAAEKLRLLDESFGQLDQNLNRQHGGIGLGLSLVRGIVALHQGRVTIESKSGKGTTVTLTLPLDDDTALHSDNLVELSGVRSRQASEESIEVSKPQERGRRLA